jgi:hypothetical protein
LTTAGTVYFGQRGNSARYVLGVLDEARISKTNRSAAWITAEYNMEKASQTMVTLGSRTVVIPPRGSQIVDLGGTTFTRGLHEGR